MPIFKFQRLKSNRFITTPFIFRLAHKKGFTLVELLISVAIIAILSTIGVASFQSYNSRSEVKNVALQFTSDLRKYQNAMISGDKNPLPGKTDTCVAPGSSLSYIAVYIVKKASNPSQLGVWVMCPPGSATIKTIGVWPDPKIAEVTDLGYIRSDKVTGSCGSYLYLIFGTLRYNSIFCPSYFGTNPPIERAFVEFSKGTVKERVYITSGGIIYEQKP